MYYFLGWTRVRIPPTPQFFIFFNYIDHTLKTLLLCYIVKKIIDCFTFFNELDLLEVRLKYLYDVVDHFVIVEANRTYSGNKKEYILQNHLKRYAPFADKIILEQLDFDQCDHVKNTDWGRKNYQRDSIKKGLEKLSIEDDDILLISDLDEIPDKSAVEKLKQGTITQMGTSFSTTRRWVLALKFFIYFFKRLRYKLLSSKKHASAFRLFYYTLIKGYSLPINFCMTLHYYYVNFRHLYAQWNGSQCVEAKWIKHFKATAIRDFRFIPLSTIKDHGWHFSYLGGKELIKNKLKNFSHQESNIPDIMSDDYIDFCIYNGYSLFEYYQDRDTLPSFEKISLNTFPDALSGILKNYQHFIIEDHKN